MGETTRSDRFVRLGREGSRKHLGVVDGPRLLRVLLTKVTTKLRYFIHARLFVRAALSLARSVGGKKLVVNKVCVWQMR